MESLHHFIEVQIVARGRRVVYRGRERAKHRCRLNGAIDPFVKQKPSRRHFLILLLPIPCQANQLLVPMSIESSDSKRSVRATGTTAVRSHCNAKVPTSQDSIQQVQTGEDDHNALLAGLAPPLNSSDPLACLCCCKFKRLGHGYVSGGPGNNGYSCATNRSARLGSLQVSRSVLACCDYTDGRSCTSDAAMQRHVRS